MIGVELIDGAAVAVAVDANGRVSARATSVQPDIVASALTAIEGLALSGVVVVALAAPAPEAAASTEAAKTLGARGPFASGVAAAAAEAWVGAARGASDVVFFSTREHVVAGILRGGVPITGARGRAASVAWLALNPVEREDYRKTGCLEAEVASAGIVRRLIWRIKSGDSSRALEAAGGDFAHITLEHVLDAARAGDGVAISVMRDTAKYLGMAAANLVAVSDPGALVLGGIMASAADLLLEPVRVEIARRLPPAMMEALTVVPALLGSDAAAIGAARLGSRAQS
jgi:predicted NBD/HSP70 family sugar kinase